MEKLNRVLRCLDACYVDDCGNCDYCGNGCSEVLMKDARDVINGLLLRCNRLEAERDDLCKRWTEARNDLIDEQMRSRDYEKKALISRAERDTARMKVLHLEAKLFKFEREAENE